MSGFGTAHPLPQAPQAEKPDMAASGAIERPDIFPLDCMVMGDVASALPKDTNRRVLHFWGYSRADLNVHQDSTHLCFVDHYEPPVSSSHGATDTPIYHKKSIEYLGLRTIDVDVIMLYFRTHFTLKVMASAEMAFSTQDGTAYKPVLTRWPASYWYFLFPIEGEGVAGKVMRDNLWDAWNPGA